MLTGQRRPGSSKLVVEGTALVGRPNKTWQFKVGGGGDNSCWQAEEDLAVTSWLWRGQLLLAGRRRPGSSTLVVEGTALVDRPKKTWQFKVGCGGDSSCRQAEEDLAVPSWLWRGQLLLAGQRRPGSSKLVVEGTTLVDRPKKTWQFQVGCGGDSSCWQAEEDLAVPGWLWRGQLLLTGQRRPGSSKLVVEGTALVGRPKKTWHFQVGCGGDSSCWQAKEDLAVQSWLWRGQLLSAGRRRPGSSKLVVEGTALVGRPNKTWQFKVGGGGDNSCWQAEEDLAVPSWLWRGQLLLAGRRRPGSSTLVVEGTALVDRPKKTWQFKVGCGGDSSCRQAEEDLAVPSWLWRGQLLLAGQRRPGSSKLVVEGTTLVDRPKKTWQFQVGCGGDSSCWQAEEDLAVPGWLWRGQLLLTGQRRPGSSKLVVEGTALVGRPKKTWHFQVGCGGDSSCWQAKEDLAVPSWLWRGQLLLTGRRRPGSSKLVVEGTARVDRPKKTWQFQVGGGGDNSCWQAKEDLAVPSWLWRGQLLLAGQRRPGSSKLVVEGTVLVDRPKKTWQFQVGCGGDSSCWQAEEDLAVPSWLWRGQLLLAGQRRPGSFKLVVEGTTPVGRPKKTWQFQVGCGGDSSCRQAEEDLALPSWLWRGQLLLAGQRRPGSSKLVVEGTALVGRPKKTWQSTVSADKRLLGVS